MQGVCSCRTRTGLPQPQAHLLLVLSGQALELCPMGLQRCLGRIRCPPPLVSQGCVMLLPKRRQLLLVLLLNLQGSGLGRRGEVGLGSAHISQLAGPSA